MIDPKEWLKYEDKLAGVVPKERFKKISISRPSKEVIESFKNIEDPTPSISDVLDDLGLAKSIPASILKPICNGKVLVGPSMTIRYIPEQDVPKEALRNDKKACLGDKDVYSISQPGDVIVFDNGGRAEISTMGGLSTQYAINAGVAGCIIDGGIRDVASMRKENMAIWSRGITPITGRHRVMTIEINGPVTIAGVVVNPGDLVVADDNGVCFIPYNLIGLVLERIQKDLKREKSLINAMLQGKTYEQLKNILPPEEW